MTALTIILAQSEVPSSLITGLSSLGVSGMWIAWLIWKDNRDSTKIDKRHEENLAMQRKLEDALRSMAESVIVGFGAMHNIDKSYSELLEKVRNQKPAP